MNETRSMVYSTCVSWFQDWIDGNSPILDDEYDASEWLEHEMTPATRVFIEYAFHTHHARNDAIMILRALYYEFILFRLAIAKGSVPALPSAPDRLKHARQTPQKSAAWHHESRELISGHEFGSIITGGKAEYNSILAKKCVPPVKPEDYAAADQNIVFLTPPDGLSPFKWGWRFEPVARDLFEMQFAEGLVYDGLGRVRHPTLPRLGASPDGMITTGPKVGRLVELKCPISRQLTGSIPVDYWVQMQLQAEVCDVHAVEYFEVQLGSMVQDESSSARFETAVGKGKLPWIGKVCVMADHEDDASNLYRYEYSPLFTNSAVGIDECLAWKPPSGVVLESALWWVKDYFTTTVLRNPRWWAEVGQPAYEQFWEDALKAREDGRFTRVSVPLFVDDSESEESDRATPYDGDDEGAQANEGTDSGAGSDVEGWQGAESDQETPDLGEAAQSDSPLDSEFGEQKDPSHTM